MSKAQQAIDVHQALENALCQPNWGIASIGVARVLAGVTRVRQWRAEGDDCGTLEPVLMPSGSAAWQCIGATGHLLGFVLQDGQSVESLSYNCSWELCEPTADHWLALMCSVAENDGTRLADA